ncbi:hypothetical protein JCM8097_004321 [Rhodosporidiobolus ruineniae]
MPWHTPQSERTGRGPVLFLVFCGIAVVVLSLQYISSTNPTALESATARFNSFISSSRPSSTCSVDRSLVAEYGAYNIKLSRVHEGSGWRVQRFMERLEEGRPVKVAVIGGSVSLGHGADTAGHPAVYNAVPETWHYHIKNWINEQYGEQDFVNGAIAATDASFFRFAWSDQVHLQEGLPDLVLIELDVNNLYDDEARNATEMMLRSILQLPNQPAVIFVGAFAKMSQTGFGGLLNGGDMNMPLMAYYDVPGISVRGPLLPALFRNASLAEPYFRGDRMHITAPVHRMLGDMVIVYLQLAGAALRAEVAGGKGHGNGSAAFSSLAA